jgi:purine-binding chemotaxis protein CheW
MTAANEAEGYFKYLVHSLGPECGYGLAALALHAVIGMLDIVQPFSRSRFLVEGGIELRGKVLPLVDLRNRDGDESRAYDERACILLVEDLDCEGPCLLGIVVESICE